MVGATATDNIADTKISFWIASTVFSWSLKLFINAFQSIELGLDEKPSAKWDLVIGMHSEDGTTELLRHFLPLRTDFYQRILFMTIVD